jgi:hypothetical protein
MLGDDDLALGVFQDAEIATTFQRLRGATPAATVVGVIGVHDDDALQGHVVAARRALRIVGQADVRADDVLEIVTPAPGLGLAAGARLRVLAQPQRVNDGRELEVLLSSVAP